MEAHMFYFAREVGKIWRCSRWEKGNFIKVNEFRCGQTWTIWPFPLSLSLYSTYKQDQNGTFFILDRSIFMKKFLEHQFFRAPQNSCIFDVLTCFFSNQKVLIFVYFTLFLPLLSLGSYFLLVTVASEMFSMSLAKSNKNFSFLTVSWIMMKNG